ncbi:MAG: OmpA family protein [Desulfobacterales bacterium]|nr:OmpA family protein [Desulfobacterales bacterium]
MRFLIWKLIFIALTACIWTTQALAIEIITRTDFSQGIVVRADLIKNADNAIILFDSSSSMKKMYKDSGKSRYQVAKETLKDRNTFLPDLGFNMGLYVYTPWKEVYPVQPYNREAFAKAIDSLPENPSGPTLISQGLSRLNSILKELKGRTVVFIYTDGYHQVKAGTRRPSSVAMDLAKKYDVCFYLISTADDYHSVQLFKNVEQLNLCSRVIGFDEFVDKEIYNSEALFTVKATKKLVTIADKKVVGLKGRPFLFNFDSTDLSADTKERLKIVGSFLNNNPSAYAVLGGHTDNIGPEIYNTDLSLRRVKAVKEHLTKNYGIAADRVVLFWFGSRNPAADNNTSKGRAMNRRVEIAVGGM